MLLLAPMAGVTSLPFRLLAKEQGCDMVVSEMVSAKGLVYGSKRTKDLLATTDKERPMAIQLFGSEVESLVSAARFVEKNYQPDMIDLNMGCPTPKIVKNGDGSALMKTPDLAYACAKAVVEAVDLPVTAKIRLGWDEDSLTAVEFAHGLAEAGVYWVTVHARTREQFYGGKARWEWIKRIKETLDIPVVGNGDIFAAEDAKRMLEQTGCDHVMIGRGAMGNPWIFREIKHFLSSGEILAKPTVAERKAMALTHLRMEMDLKGDYVGIREMRPHLSWYLKGVPGSSGVRGKLNQATSFSQVKELLGTLV